MKCKKRYSIFRKPSKIKVFKEKHSINARDFKSGAAYGWYRYDIRFALPVYDDKTGNIARYNIYSASMLVRHANDDRKYLYDILAIKKETSSPLE